MKTLLLLWQRSPIFMDIPFTYDALNLMQVESCLEYPQLSHRLQQSTMICKSHLSVIVSILTYIDSHGSALLDPHFPLTP